MLAPMDASSRVQIGELGRRVGVTPAVLRAWERRYGVLEPDRARSGQRLYSEADEARIRTMRRHMAEGYSTAIAARLAAASAPATDASADLGAVATELREALDRFDAAGAHAALDRAFAAYPLDTVLSNIALPFLGDLGARWKRGDATIAQEHFASDLIGERLRGLSRGWDGGAGPRTLVACPAGERHDLGPLCFALALRERGWRVTWLGPDTPVDAIADTARRLEPELVIVAAVRAGPLRRCAGTLAALAAERPLGIGGRGASESIARLIGARQLPPSPIAAADLVAGLTTTSGSRRTRIGEPSRRIKGVAYHDPELRRDERGWRASVVGHG